MSAITRHQKGRRFSRVVAYSGTAYLSGVTANNWNGDIVTQTREVLAKADDLLAQVGVDRSSILSATIWLRDINDFAGMNTVWDEWVDIDHPPARATIEGKLAAPDVLVEIQFVAALGRD